jgi:hypothetical protein
VQLSENFFQRKVDGSMMCYINVTNGFFQTINVTRQSSLINLIVTLINLINVTNTNTETRQKRQTYSKLSLLGGIHYF